MKKILSIIICLFLAFMIPHTVYAANQPVTLSAGSVSGTTVTVSGTTSAKAVMVQVRDANDAIIGMNALGVSGGAFSGSFTVAGLTAGATYTVYAADYEGGAWSTMQVTVPATTTTTVVNGQTVAASPKTGAPGMPVWLVLLGLSFGGVALLKIRRVL